TNGAGTFGCRVNGKVWLPQSGRYPGVSADLIGNQIQISGYNTNSDEWIGITINPVSDTCYYKFPKYDLIKASGLYLNNKDFITDSLKKGYIHYLRVDYNQGVFSGIFEFDTYSTNKNDTIHITDGRFDIHK
ncbi:MAG: DUF6252 family protein, partial [Bacteroidota bacterium]